jgi:hypothetical protein
MYGINLVKKINRGFDPASFKLDVRPVNDVQKIFGKYRGTLFLYPAYSGYF